MLRRKVLWVFVGLFCPEIVLASSFEQWKMARQLHQWVQDRNSKSPEEGSVCRNGSPEPRGEGSVCRDEISKPPEEVPVCQDGNPLQFRKLMMQQGGFFVKVWRRLRRRHQFGMTVRRSPCDTINSYSLTRYDEIVQLFHHHGRCNDCQRRKRKER